MPLEKKKIASPLAKRKKKNILSCAEGGEIGDQIKKKTASAVSENSRATESVGWMTGSTREKGLSWQKKKSSFPANPGGGMEKRETQHAGREGQP